MVYAIDNKNSFDNLEEWLNEIKTQGNPEVKIFLIGNKIDLEEKRQIPYKTGEKFSNENNLNLFLETSAKTVLMYKMFSWMQLKFYIKIIWNIRIEHQDLILL